MDATVAFYRKLGLTIPTPTGCGSIITAAGYRGQQPPYDAFWGARYAVIEDPDGNAVGIMSPVDPDRRSQQDFGEDVA
jgi:Glyoxalase/Bleomycin resistance protein/Dioxygenase superfamily